MKTFIITITSGLFALSTALGQSLGNVDQEQPIIDITVGGLAIGGSSEQKLAQIVTPSASGLLTEVRLPVACDSSAELRVEIQGVANGKPDGTVLAVEFFNGTNHPPFFPAPGIVTLRSFLFTAPVVVHAGQPFAIVLFATASSPLSGCGVFQGPVGDSYSGGDLFYDSRPNTSGVWVCVCEFAGSRLDLPFQTVVTAPVRPVLIDVKPANTKNLIRVDSGSMVAVALIGDPSFDVTLVDISTIRFGPDSAPVARSRELPQDINRDGFQDLVLYFRIRQTGIQVGNKQVSLAGKTVNGGSFLGSDLIQTIDHGNNGEENVER